MQLMAQIPFEQTYGVSSMDEAFNKLIPTNDNQWLMVGYNASEYGNTNNVYWVKIDNDGAVSWEYLHESANNEEAVGVVGTPDNGYILLCQSINHTQQASIKLIKIDADGLFQWQHAISEIGINTFAYDIIEVPSEYNTFVIAAGVQIDTLSESASLIKISLDDSLSLPCPSCTNQQIYTNTIDGARAVIPYENEDGFAFVSTSSIFGTEVMLTFTDSSLNPIAYSDFSDSYSEFIPGNMRGKDLLLLDNGNIVLVGESYNSTFTPSILLLEIGSDGSNGFIQVVNTEDRWELNDITTTNDGSIVIAGTAYSNSSNEQKALLVKRSTISETTFNEFTDVNNASLNAIAYNANTNQLVLAGKGSNIIAGNPGQDALAGFANINLIPTLLNAYGTPSNSHNDIGYAAVFDGENYIMAGYSDAQNENGNFDAKVMFIEQNGFAFLEKYYDFGANEYIFAVARNEINDVLLVGRQETNSNQADMLLICIDAAGNLKWSEIIGAANRFETAWSVKATSDGGWVVCGTKELIDETLMYVLKLNEDGDTMWSNTYGNHYAIAYGIEEVEDGYILVGRNFVVDADDNFVTAAYLTKINFTGGATPVWSNSIAESSWSRFYDLTLDSEGNIMLIGSQHNEENNNFDLLYAKFTANGNYQWHETISHEASSIGNYAIEALPDNSFLLLGNHEYEYESGFPNTRAYVSKISSAGSELWTNEYGTNIGSNTILFDLIPFNDYSFAIAGSTEYNQNTTDWYLSKLNENGNLEGAITHIDNLSIEPVSKQAYFSILPNPNDGTYCIALTQALSEPAYLNITDVNGRIIHHFAIENIDNQQICNNILGDLSSGMYFVQLYNNNINSTQKMLINR